MSRTRMLQAATAAGILVAVGALGTVAGHAASEDHDSKRLSVFIHDSDQAVLDVGAKGPTSGDVFTYHGNVFPKKGGAQLGRFGGGCTTLGAAGSVPEDSTCSLDYALPQGQLFTRTIATSERMFSGKDVAFAILGGTGAYRGARGDGTIRVPADVPDQTDAYVVFHLR